MLESEKQIKTHWEKEGVGSFLGDRLEAGRRKFVGCAINDYYEGPLVIKNEKARDFYNSFGNRSNFPLTNSTQSPLSQIILIRFSNRLRYAI